MGCICHGAEPRFGGGKILAAWSPLCRFDLCNRWRVWRYVNDFAGIDLVRLLGRILPGPPVSKIREAHAVPQLAIFDRDLA